MLDLGFVTRYGDFWAMLVSRSIGQLVNVTVGIQNAIPNRLYGIGLRMCVGQK